MAWLLCVQEEKEDLPSAPFTRLMRMNAPEWKYILMGCMSGILNGGVQPAFAIIFSKIIGVSALNIPWCPGHNNANDTAEFVCCFMSTCFILLRGIKYVICIVMLCDCMCMLVDLVDICTCSAENSTIENVCIIIILFL